MKRTFFLLMVILNTILIFMLLKSIDNTKTLKKDNISLIYKENLIKDNYIISASNKIDYLDPNIKLYNENGEVFLLKNIINTKTLIFSYSKFSCSICTSQEAKIINEYIDIHPNKNIIVIGNTDYFGYILSYKKIT